MWEEGGGRRTSPGAGSERWSGFPWQLPSWYLAGKAPKVVNSFKLPKQRHTVDLF